MTRAILDSTVIIHLYRRNPRAMQWLADQRERVAITPITWLEVMTGAPGKAGQATCKLLLGQFEMRYLTRSDMLWAMNQLETYRLSHGVTMNDCLIASVAYRLNVPLLTHNLRDIRILLGDALTQQPY